MSEGNHPEYTENASIVNDEEKGHDFSDRSIGQDGSGPKDDTTADIKHSLEPCVDAEEPQPTVNQLTGDLNEDSYQARLAKELISYILENPGCQCKEEIAPENIENESIVEEEVADHCDDALDEEGYILQYLKLGMNPDRRQEAVTRLLGKLNEDGYQEKLARAIINYIIDCPETEDEFGERLQCVLSVMECWPDYGPLVLNAINAALTAVESLTQLQSLNLYVFTGCCLDLKAFDGKDLRIDENESTSLMEQYARNLRKRINRNGSVVEAESEDDSIEDDVDTRHETEEDVNLLDKLLDRCCRILSFLFCCRFRYI
uniref:MIF4G domain-containing protein n=1 Tax=Panagrellus redivivus TaxID=6233 RepID=A0A7E4VDZ4_PANRE